jgi:hypothetical protein
MLEKFAEHFSARMTVRLPPPPIKGLIGSNQGLRRIRQGVQAAAWNSASAGAYIGRPRFDEAAGDHYAD